MTSRDAFIQVPKGTRFHYQERGAESLDECKDVRMIACGRSGCNDCAIARDTIPAKGGSFMQFAPTGALMTFSPGKKLTLRRVRRPGFTSGIAPLDQNFCDERLCGNCSGLDIQDLLSHEDATQVLSYTFNQLKESSQSCPLCALMMLTLVDPGTFQANNDRPIVLSARHDRQAVVVSIPSKEVGYDEYITDRQAELEVYSSGETSSTGTFKLRKLPGNSNETEFATKHLSECLANHEKCKLGPRFRSRKYRPSRLIDVGSADPSVDPHIKAGSTCSGDYLTLTYCWGDPTTITKSTTKNLLQFTKGIPFASLSPIFQDAMTFTRLLGYQYIWIDSLCILQDSDEDKRAQLPSMDDVYASSLLTISACIATSGNTRLFTPRRHFNKIELKSLKNVEAVPVSYITDHIFHDFAEDVSQGSLSTRAWCFQERLLGPRLLHFGQDQLYWECHEGIWEEASTERKWYTDFKAIDDGKLREALWSDVIENSTPGQTLVAGRDMEGEEFLSEWRKIRESIDDVEAAAARDAHYAKRPLYDSWYKAVSRYTSRDLTNKSDKLLAISGVAARFNDLLRDTYFAGLWAGDIGQGLLWSRRAFELVHVDPEIAKRPGMGGWGESAKERNKIWRGAPSWSWASVDGAVHWVQDRKDMVNLANYALLENGHDGTGDYGGLKWASLRAQGQLLEIADVTSLGEEIRGTSSELEIRLRQQSRWSRPEIDMDDPGWEALLGNQRRLRPLYFFLVGTVPLRPEELSKYDTRGDINPILGWALVLRYWTAERAFRRVGFARVLLADFFDKAPVEIDIL